MSPAMNAALKIHREERPAASLVPLQAHLTETIAKTRDGSLVAAFELAGTAFEAKTPEQRDLYKEQLNVALRNSASPRLALWSALTRRRIQPQLARTYPNAFAQQVADAYAALQRHVSWIRGREPEQRVAVIRPKLPTRRLTLALVERLADRITNRRPDAPRPRQASSPRLRRAA